MRTPKPLFLAVCLFPAALSAEPLTKPVGELTVNQSMVRAGLRPLLSWEIRYPKPLDQIVDLSDPGTITVTSRTEVEIRVVGVAFQNSSQILPASLQTQFNGGSWQSLFVGNETEVDASEVLYQGIAEVGTTIDFSARGGNGNGGWSFSADTLAEGPQVTPLRKGDYVPHYVPAYNQGTIESYLSQYISAENEVTIGPRDLIYLFELGTTNPQSSFFDMQDIALVITFNDVPEPSSN